MIEKLFECLSTENKITNPFETQKCNMAFDKLYDTFSTEYDENLKQFELLDELVLYERQNAFYVGYKTAVNLLLDGRFESMGGVQL